MPRLTHHQYNELLKTELVKFLFGQDHQESVVVHKGFAAYHSEFFAGSVSKSGFEGTIELTDVGVNAVKIFARWCYESRLDAPVLQKLSPDQAQELKHSLIDVWIFAEMHGIPKLQNQSMSQLRSLFSHDLTLLTAEDIQFVFDKTSSVDNPLRQMLVLILVVKIDLGREKFDKYDAIAQAHAGFFATFFTYQRTWLMAHGKAKPKDKAEKLVEMLEDEGMVAKVRVRVPPPPEWVLVLSGATPQPQPQPQKEGEVIELD
ncbi:hypothetical protein M409DRAFT_26648 [Zasmidium cellare ATCC 36951]|uniref:BTB domain-containing protein n=1 Tax=Zasmidium cellare ATCC 36951 TaxID=1080233 RepID=A0A6A6C7G9_ZASCE|nr:uncharacterized protein M409DRAFT_26648 [Zasmidium cellare ATCC 36951]KAF2162793.1 hypothetical protein M409DRAFT_26648 [Zasmidium cellare ATCC 36951]